MQFRINKIVMQAYGLGSPQKNPEPFDAGFFYDQYLQYFLIKYVSDSNLSLPS